MVELIKKNTNFQLLNVVIQHSQKSYDKLYHLSLWPTAILFTFRILLVLSQSVYYEKLYLFILNCSRKRKCHYRKKTFYSE